MSKFISKLISSFIKSNNEIHKSESNEHITDNKIDSSNEIDKNKSNEHVTDNKIDSSQKIWKKEYNPLRQMILWGWDENNNPSFLVLYGSHDFDKSNNIDLEDGVSILKDDITYTSFTIFKGKEGHLPSFKAVKIIGDKMYFKKGLEYRWWSWHGNPEYIVKEFKNLKSNEQISFPYFVSQSHDQYVQKIEKQKIQFNKFKLANNPNEILKLDIKLHEYLEDIINISSNNNIYMRKKKLNELLTKNPPKEIYNMLLEIGSSEVICGLFLELAKTSNPILIQEAINLIDSEIKWVDANYANGLKRCAKIYLNALNPELRADRINWIHEFLFTMDLHLIHIKGKDIPEDKIINGSAYRKYALHGFLKDYYETYDHKKREYIKHKAPKRYKDGPYTDGTKLKLIDFKNTIQEAEIYELADVIGKIAYYLDAPRLTYYFKGNSKAKTLKYFHRYIKRIINHYAENNQDKFMESMKYLLTSYTQYDNLCKFNGNFQFNEFIRYYLYYDFKEKAPTSWSARYDWITNDQLMRLEGRHEFCKKIWDNHLDVVADIALYSQIEVILKACYYIFKDSPNTDDFVQNIEYNQLVSLATISYEPIGEMFMAILNNKINAENTFDSKLMLALIGTSNEEMHDLAMAFFKRTNGLFSTSTIADLLLLENIDTWSELFKQNLLSLEKDQYADSIKQFLNKIDKFNKTIPKNIEEILQLSANKVQDISQSEKIEIMSKLIETMFNKENMPQWIESFIEELIFSFSYEDLYSLLKEIIIKPNKCLSSARNKRIISILESIKNNTIPADSQIIDILDFGTSKIIKILFNSISKNSKELENRFSTLLIMLESEVTLLNKKAEEVFDSIPSEKQKKLHALIIDSPVAKAYSFGLKKLDIIYENFIPEEFIIQMLEHRSTDIKAYISDKTNSIIDNLGNGNKNLFMYYLKTLLLLPNKISKSKDKIYEVIPKFALMHKDKLDEIESILLDIGGCNVIIDSERSLVALAKIREEVMLLES